MLTFLILSVSRQHLCIFPGRFRNKYHPVCKSQLKALHVEGYKSRHAAFSILRDHGLIKDVTLCNTMSKQITKLMDSGEL